MAIVFEDILRLKVFQTLFGQQVLNVQHYRVLTTSIGVSPANLVDELAQLWFNQFRDMQAASVAYVRAELEQLGSPDFGVYTYGPLDVGAISTESMPPFVSLAFRQVRSTKLTRNGQKRIAGVVEAATVNSILSPQNVVAYTNLAAVLLRDNVPLDPQGGGVELVLLEPVIFGGFTVAAPLGRVNSVSGLVLNPNLSTQNTRKVRTREGV